jgi:hypothetical protein
MILGIVTLAAAFFYLAYEFIALARGWKLITTYVRDGFYKYPPMGALVALGIGLLFGHFFWCDCRVIGG